MANKNTNIGHSAIKNDVNGKNRSIKKYISFYTILGNILLLVSCNMSTQHDFSNRLQFESSQYLRAHASNPVDWYPWGDEAFSKAASEEKLVIISIGYYACHWCQVMEKETFTDTTVARLMNDYFVSIKVDREERPDIDLVYSKAAQKMTGSSGWPLNIVATSDGTPLFAGTYFENADWQAILQRANYLYQENPEEILEQANRLAESLKITLRPKTAEIELDLGELDNLWLTQSDTVLGGIRGTQKFPNSPYLSALLDYTYYHPNQKLDKFLRTTLDNMALGGMFDHLDGGFARYATDSEWKIPHFEKMLYDNAQLASIYAKAYQKFNDPFYLQIAERTTQYLLKEFKSEEGGFYSSINAVSDEVEGGYYTWSLNEIESLSAAAEIKTLFNITSEGNWQNGLNVLYANGRNKIDYLEQIEKPFVQEMLNFRVRRTPPPKDEKVITGWNALTLEAFITLYRVTGKATYLDEAQQLAAYLKNNHLDSEAKKVFRTEDQGTIGFLEDYSLLAGAFIQLYQVSFEESWLQAARTVSEEMVSIFGNDNSPLLDQSTASNALFMESYQTLDTDLPSGNAQAAANLTVLSEFYYDTHSQWKKLAENMVLAEQDEIEMAGAFTGSWIRVMLSLENPPYEIAILGEDAQTVRLGLDQHFRPDIIFLGGKSEGSIPLLENKLLQGHTIIYVCQNKTCRFPTEDLSVAYDMTISEGKNSISD